MKGQNRRPLIGAMRVGTPRPPARAPKWIAEPVNRKERRAKAARERQPTEALRRLMRGEGEDMPGG